MFNTAAMRQEWKMVKQGKVRSVYVPVNNSELEVKMVALVAGDGVSAFDEELGVSVRNKGKYLTKMSTNWFRVLISAGFLTAYITSEDSELPEFFQRYNFYGRTTIMRKLRMIPVEAIVRGYITGSAWKAYQEGEREICGVKLEEGLRNSEQLRKPIFTPTTKAPVGQYDENLNRQELVEILKASGLTPDFEKLADILEETSLTLYEIGAKYASDRGIILADTKFEFGLDEFGHVTIADEVFTPDSSRFWSVNDYVVGQNQASMDKQIIRDYIASEKAAGREINGISSDILEETAAAYDRCCNMLFGD